MAELFMENESWNIAHKVLDKMAKLVYGVVENDLDDMYLPTLFSEAERITNAHKVSDGMTGRDHVKVVHVFIINESKFSLVLVGNEMVVPLWDPGIGLNALTSVKLASQTNDWFIYPKVVDIELRNVDCWEEALRALCYKLPMDLVEASILQIRKKRLFDNVSGVKVANFTASWEDRAKHVLISKIEIIALKFYMDLMAFRYKWHIAPKLQEASFGLLPGIIMAFVLGDLLKMNGYSKQVVAISESTITEGARQSGAPKITRVDINFNKFEIKKYMGSKLAQKVGMGAFNTNYIDTSFLGLYVAARPDCLSNLAHCIMLEISKLCYQVLDVVLTRAKNQLESSLKKPCWIVLLNATYSWFPFDPGGYSYP
ncbi:putative mitochondrial-processing peptidase subunit beta, mitochondrial [Nicotiana attenuata]|uniref:Mitochondrial-processing peptidase subunit beta, mitochondrial n=1 Tax=Nicotiana attenuata TaxID=49451 RepID=A0A314L4D0_NICAT|nr:putative mitochondrial-processing peptidase subunit beta, mitochondrial [Nicotiana attenuata]